MHELHEKMKSQDEKHHEHNQTLADLHKKIHHLTEENKELTTTIQDNEVYLFLLGENSF